MARPLHHPMFGAWVLGLAVGAGTAVLQQHLGHPWHAFANSASPWVSGMFAAGAGAARPLRGATAGLLTALSELASYYTTVLVFGWHFLGGGWVVLWLCAGLLAGPLYGWAGARWARASRSSGLTSALLPAAWLTEAVVLWRIGLVAPAVLFAAVGAVVVLLLGMQGRRLVGVAFGTILLLPAGVLGEVLFALVHRRLG